MAYDVAADARAARIAARVLANATSQQKNAVLARMAGALQAAWPELSDLTWPVFMRTVCWGVKSLAGAITITIESGVAVKVVFQS